MDGGREGEGNAAHIFREREEGGGRREEGGRDL
jgi:hypothetical protein